MLKTVLITGGYGFLGRAVARKFKTLGFRTVGIGHGNWTPGEAQKNGFDLWQQGDVSLATLSSLNEAYELVVHCAGNGYVNYSLTHPFEAFQMTVQSTAELLEHLRRTESKALLIYPSSAAVYGAADDQPLKESDSPNPVSPYGHHKRITEELLECYSRYFGARVAIIRFFSIYGPGLAKQLLWDAAGKLSSGATEAIFWGTGAETRDWIYVDDAATLIAKVAEAKSQFMIVNGAAGDRVTVDTVLQALRNALGVTVEIGFNGNVRPGDPRFYHADVSRARQLGFQPSVKLAEGLESYAQWFKTSWSK